MGDVALESHEGGGQEKGRGRMEGLAVRSAGSSNWAQTMTGAKSGDGNDERG